MPRENRGTRLSDAPNSAGFFEVVWTERGRSRRISTGSRTRREAENFLAGFLIEREEAERAPQAARQAPGRTKRALTIAEIVHAYESEHIRPHAIDVERALFCGLAIARFFGAMLPSEITASTILAYGKKRAISDETLRRELAHLRAALNHAVRQKRVRVDDVPHIPMPARVEPRDRTLTEPEINALLAAALIPQVGGNPDALPRIYRFIALMVHAPARPEAVLGLTWFQVDLEKRLINYRAEGRRKTKKKRTPVPISNGLLPILKRAKAEATSEFVLDHPGSIRKAFARAVERAGLKEVTPYVLRHTWATHAVSSGVPIAFVAAVLADTVETVTRNYVHLAPGHLRGAVEIWGVTPRKETTGAQQ